MVSVNTVLADELIRHQVAIQGYSNSVVQKIIALLNRSDARLAAELKEALDRMDPASFTVERIESLLGAVRATNAAAYEAIGRELPQELLAFTQYETSYQAQAIQSVMPVSVQVATVSPQAVYTAAMARPFQGVLLRDVLKEMEAKRARDIRRAVAQGFVEGKTTAQIVREIRGTRAAQYSDGLMQASRREIEAVTRTALGHMARNAQDRTIEANADLIKALVWQSTIDLRTSSPCRVRSGKQYTTAHKPIGHDLPWGGGPGNFHWNCRSHATYQFKSNKELGIDAPDIVMENGQRASMDGQLPAETTYFDWLQKQSAARQDEVLGPTRGKLLRQGGLSMEQMYSQKGMFLTLDDLRARDAKAFERAGL